MIVIGMVITALALLAGLRVARAAPPVELKLGSGLPFSHAQLRRAVALRLPARPGREMARVVVVRAFGRNSVMVQHGPRRIVPLPGLTGAAAARRVALAIYDLARTGATTPRLPGVGLPFGVRTGKLPVARAATVAATLALLSPAALASPVAAGASAEVRDFVTEGRRFINTGRSFRRTLRRLVQRAYLTRKKVLLATSNKRIRLREAEAQLQRVAAIAAFEDFLRHHPAQPRWTPDAMLRLAELYFEKANDEYLAAVDRQLAALHTGSPPRPDYRRSVQLYRRLIRRYPGHRGVDSAIYLLGFCLAEMDRPEAAREAFLSLVCANRHRPPQSSAPAPAAAPAPGEVPRKLLASRVPANPRKVKLDTGVYGACKARPGAARLAPEAWIRLGEHHFDRRELGPAIAAYARVLKRGAMGNRFYGPALYKMAWTYYQADRFTEAITNFDRLVVFSDRQAARTGSSGGDMRPESIQYLAVCFTEEDWDGDGNADTRRAMGRLEKFYARRRDEKHVFEVYRRVADTLLDVARDKEATRLYRLALGRWPLHPQNPLLQDQLITALSRQQRFDEALLARMAMAHKFGAGSAWDRHNRKEPGARKLVRGLLEQALLQSAVVLHTRARGHREAAVTAKSASLLERAHKGYAQAAAAYGRYLELFPRAKNAYQIRYALGDCLFYSRQFAWAARAYAAVRDSRLGRRHREEAAFATAKALEWQVSASKVRLPAIPQAGLSRVAVGSQPAAGTPMPAAVRRWQAALDTYVRLFPRHPRAPTLTYKAAELSLRYGRLEDARKRYAVAYRDHCSEPISMQAGNALLTISVMQKKEAQTEAWALRLKAKKCGGDTAVAARTAQEAKVLHDGLKLKRAMRLLTAGKHKQSAAAFLAAAEGALLPADAVTALLNAGAALVRDKQHARAAAAYERAFARQSSGKRAGMALWRAAQAHEHAGQFDQATARYLLLAEGAAFKGFEHRLQSMLNAALLLERDHRHVRAAHLLLRYARLATDADRAAAAQFKAALCLQKSGDHRAMVKAFGGFIKRHGRTAKHGPRVVEALARMGLDARERGHRRAGSRYLSEAVAQYHTRALPPASEAAGYAARAAFTLADGELKRFRALKLGGPIRVVLRQKKRMERRAVALRKRYEAIYSFRRARWSLGATFRRGEVLEHFARALDAAIRAIPVPAAVRRMGPAAVDFYTEELDKVLQAQVDPISDAAREIYRQCVLNGRKLKVDNLFTKAALNKMRGYEPGKWPLPIKVKVQRALQ